MRSPALRQLAFCSDIHGNAPALNTLLAQLALEPGTELYVAGDLFLGGDQPLEVWQALQAAHAHCIRGVSDTALVRIEAGSLRPGSDAQRLSAAQFLSTQRMLGDLILERLRRLDDRLRIPLPDGSEVLLVHGSPADPMQELSHDMSDDEMLACLADDPADVVVCGGSHVAFQRQLPGVLVVGVGSVGASPEGANAHYTLLTVQGTQLQVEQRWVAYGDATAA